MQPAHRLGKLREAGTEDRLEGRHDRGASEHGLYLMAGKFMLDRRDVDNADAGASARRRHLPGGDRAQDGVRGQARNDGAVAGGGDKRPGGLGPHALGIDARGFHQHPAAIAAEPGEPIGDPTKQPGKRQQ